MRERLAASLGIKLTATEVRYKKEGGPVAGAHARIETAGELSSRISATRVALLGPFALLARKRQDLRELYLTVEGPGYEFVVDLKPKQSADARKVAARINTLSIQASDPAPEPVAPIPPPAPAGQWVPDPHGRHELRYYDGTRWT